MFNNQIIAGSSGQGGGSFYSYTIDQSLRFNDNDSAYLNRTPASAGNQKTWTWSAWVKRANIGTSQTLFCGGTGSTLSVEIRFGSNNKIEVLDTNNTYLFSTTQLFRDVSSWYHFVIECDTTQATVNDRTKLYVNGEQVTSFSTDNRSNFSQNEDTAINSANAHYIARWINGGGYFDGYMAEVNFIDGTALDPTSFGETSNGIWVPKAYSGSYGTNGFYLSFADSAAIGDDLSGNTNDWTANNLAARDVVRDSPTNSFCTLNPLTHGTYPTLSEGNLKIASVYSADLCGVTSTWFPTTGKWYWEVHSEGSTSTYPYLGITDQRQVLTNSTKGSFYSVAWLRTGGSAAQTGTNTYMGTITKENATSWTNDDIIMFALDVDARKLWIGKNGTWNDSGDPGAGTGENASWTVDTGVSPSFMGYNGQGLASVFNFGQDGTFAGNQTAQGNADDNGVGDFYYSPPSGFLAMATSNIEDGNIGPNSTTTSDEHFDTILFTAATTNGTYTHGDISFRPDLSWIKNRNNVERHFLADVVRGNTSITDKFLVPNTTAAEGANGSSTSFSVTDTGYEFVESSISSGELYYNARTYVGWNWKAGGTAANNTDGDITVSLSANTVSGVSIGEFTKGSGTQTVGHGLGKAPTMIWLKRTDSTGSWFIYHAHNTSAPETDYLRFNSTNGTTDDATVWGDTAPTSSVFTVAGAFNSGETISFYAFTDIESFSKTGKYVGASSTNGAFVNVGFRPAFVLIKSTSSGTDWCIFDNKRLGYNVDNNLMRLGSVTEQTDDDIDFLSNGFKLRRSSTNFNNSSHTYVYIAFAEAPEKYSNAR